MNVFCVNCALLTILLTQITLIAAQTMRLCAPEDVYDYCVQMRSVLPGSIECVKARDKFACMYLITRDEADVISVEPEDLYLAGRLYNLEPFAMELINEKAYKHKAAVLIPRNSQISSLADLAGKKSCHSSVANAAGWNIPVGFLLAVNTMTPDCKGELYSAENFFSSSCAAGRWSTDPVVDALLKKRHPKLCELCKKPSSCSSTDEYSGYLGAIKCLIDGSGEVAFTTIDETVKFFRDNPQYHKSDYQFLCVDGYREAVSSEACSWASVPTNAFVIRKGKSVNQRRIFTLYLQQLMFRPGNRPTPWLTRFFISSNNVTNIEEVDTSRQTWDKYLDNYVTSIEQPLPGCERRNVTFCVTSPTALSKCLDMQKVAYTRRIRPDVRCINAGDSRSACIEAIKNQKADVMTLDAGEMYQAARYDGLRPIARERNSYSNIASYAVAVIRAPSEITSLSMLVNSTSCHAGYNTIEGWIAPVGALIEEGLMEKYECDRAKQVAELFAGSCVPGAIDYKYRLNATEVVQLCKQCVGDARGENFCFDSPSERYAGPAGAFRCLAEGRGDVAFVNHLIPFKYTDGRSFEFWTRTLRSDDFRLLCRQGGQGYLNDFEKCNLAKIPSNFIVMSSNVSNDEYIDNLHVVIQLSDELSRKSEHSFKIFGTYYNVSDLIFSDTTTNIVALPDEISYDEALGEYFPILEDMDPDVCGAAFKHSASNSLLALALLFYLILKCNFQ